MPLRFLEKDELRATDRHVANDTYETYRFLLASDQLGVTVTDIVLKPGVDAVYGYDHHIEIAYCIEGEAIIRDHAGGPERIIAPGTMWIANKGDRFSFVANQPTRLICVFTPPFEGSETGFAGDQ
ncbi:MAG: ectoine synthase [Sphingomonas sp.]|nr:ectoine synthase [Sphingomonas sp.]